MAVVGGKGFCLVIAVSQKALRDMRTDKERSSRLDEVSPIERGDLEWKVIGRLSFLQR